MRRLLFVTMAVITVIGACRQTRDQPVAAATSSPSTPPRAADSVPPAATPDTQVSISDADSGELRGNGFIEGGPREWFGETRKRVRAALGEPDRIEGHPDTSKLSDPNVDSLVTFHYQGATFVFYTLDGVHDDELIDAAISDARFLRSSPIQLGSTPAQVRSYFGDPSQGSTPQMEYTSFGGIPNHLVLSFDSDRLVKLRWIYGLD